MAYGALKVAAVITSTAMAIGQRGVVIGVVTYAGGRGHRHRRMGWDSQKDTRVASDSE
jgi:hypothetical protein